MAPISTPIYHITHISNLRGILESRGLSAKNQIRGDYLDIAYKSLQERRTTTPVPCGPLGYLHDYVPFYFTVKSPMLYVIFKGGVETYSGGQESVVYLVSTAQSVQNSDLNFVFTDGHAVVGFTNFFDDLNELSKVNWDIINQQYWWDSNQFPDRKRPKQAEFLVHQFFPFGLISEIVVKNQEMKENVESLLSMAYHKPLVCRRPNWFY